MSRLPIADENSRTLASFWGTFINWKLRRTGENQFLTRQLTRFKTKRVLDAALGDGCDAIHLIKNGLDVTGNEIDPFFMKVAKKNAARQGVRLITTAIDWRKLSNKFDEESFDAVICLGNSLGYLLSPEDQQQAVNEFHRVLRIGGVLITDERNYQYFLDNRDAILSSGVFRYTGRYVYCGARVQQKPIHISGERLVMGYSLEGSPKKASITMYPFKRGALKQLIIGVGFKSVRQFSDYDSRYNIDADFYQYVCVK